MTPSENPPAADNQQETINPYDGEVALHIQTLCRRVLAEEQARSFGTGTMGSPETTRDGTKN